MAGIKLIVSNRVEMLAEALAAELSHPLADPLAPERIIVPNRGVARWLSLRLAARNGVFARALFLYPDNFLDEAHRLLFPEAPAPERYDPKVVAWRLMGAISKKIDEPSFSPVRGYLGKMGDASLGNLSLCEKISGLFELYQIFRPELLKEWEKGGGEGWQCELWREIASGSGENTKARRLEELAGLTTATAAKPPDFPSRVLIFGLPQLAPLRIDAFRGLSNLMEVKIFAQNPSRDYWGDQKSQKEAARAALARGSEDLDEAPESGHPLLASLGRAGREFFESLLVRDIYGEERFCEPEGESLLSTLQRDLLHLAPYPRAGGKAKIPHKDASITVNSCHGPMREVEVLYDNLLDLFERVEGLLPSDVLISTPDIEGYAPLIEAVFGQETDPKRRIPISVADKSAGWGGVLVKPLMDLLSLDEKRFSAPALLEVAQAAPVMRRWGFCEGDLALVREWVEEARIRWGIDGSYRKERGLFEYSDNSWRDGLERLALGYVMGEGGRDFMGMLPCPSVWGSQSETLGKFWDFCEFAFASRSLSSREMTLSQWSSALRDIFLKLQDGGEEGREETLIILDELDDLARMEALSGYGGKISLKAALKGLTEKLSERDLGGGYLRGRVTVSAMRPFRSLPFRVIMLLGMNDGAFPRRARGLAFDEMAKKRLPGDPSPRDEDRYLFLEMILSARDALYISYTGQSASDNSEKQPSVVVNELLDALDEGFCAEDGGPARQKIFSRHRLSAFSRHYFEKGRDFFSFSVENLEGAKSFYSPPREAGGLCDEPLPEPPEKWLSTTPADFAAFFRNPSEAFLRKVLAIRYEPPEEVAPEQELFVVEGLDRYKILDRMVSKRLSGSQGDGEYDFYRLGGHLPPAVAGKAQWAAIEAEASGLFDAIHGNCDPLAFGNAEISLELGRISVKGTLKTAGESGLLRFRAGSLSEKHLCVFWVEHLLWCASPLGDEKGSTLIITREKEDKKCVARARRLPYVPDALSLLGTLAELYLSGGKEPLPFFPAASKAYAESILKGKGEEEAQNAAINKWAGGEYSVGEVQNPYVSRCFGETGPPEAFRRVALDFFAPLLAAQGKKDNG